MRPATLAVHAGGTKGENEPVAPPIVTASTYTWPSFSEEPEYVYSRYSNPNRDALEAAVAALEGAKYGQAFSSGMAAISACFEWAKAGDHVLIADDIYGGTVGLGDKVLPGRGLEVGRFDAMDPEGLSKAVKPNTKLAIFETPTNPTLKVVDIAANVVQAQKAGILTVLDNTFATPYLQNPLAFGVDAVMHSTTKYLGGHSDVLGGIVVTNRADLHEHLHMIAKNAGSIPGPFDCWLVVRGIRSLGARMRVHCENAQAVAHFLEEHPRVSRVHYPGLPSNIGHSLASKQMRAFGGMLSFEVLGDAVKVGEHLKMIRCAASLGGVETLVSYPPVLSHKGLTPEERLARGIPDRLLRLSLGLEDTTDITEDLDQALKFS